MTFLVELTQQDSSNEGLQHMFDEEMTDLSQNYPQLIPFSSAVGNSYTVQDTTNYMYVLQRHKIQKAIYIVLRIFYLER